MARAQRQNMTAALPHPPVLGPGASGLGMVAERLCVVGIMCCYVSPRDPFFIALLVLEIIFPEKSNHISL